jgi:hypothetical protein
MTAGDRCGRWLIMPALVVTMITAACNPRKEMTLERIGIEQRGDASPGLVYAACPGELVTQIRVVRFSGHVVEPADRVVWQIVSDKGSPLPLRTRLGAEVPGFSTVVAPQELKPDATYAVILRTSLGTVAQVDFVAQDLEQGVVRTPSGTKVSFGSFVTEAKSACP